jgi:hypothetical protein
VSAFLRECAVEFGSADAALPGALRNEHASGRYFWLRPFVEHNAEHCPWLAEKLLACRSGAPMPAAALAPDVTRHDVSWGDEGARRHEWLRLTHGGYGLKRDRRTAYASRCWAQGPVGVTRGKHFFQVCFTARAVSVTALGVGVMVSFAPGDGHDMVGWVDDNMHGSGWTSCMDHDNVGWGHTTSSGAVLGSGGHFLFGTAPLAGDTRIDAPANRPCVIGCLLNLDATPARMTVFVDGEPLAVQCPYEFPKDGRAWFPSVGLWDENIALHSCAM